MEDEVKPFSQELEGWLKSNKPKTIYSLNDLFGEKSFAVIIMVLMFVPALPLPTGGVSHIFEIIVALLIGELLVGMKKVWLPERWKHMKMSQAVKGKAIPMIIKRVKWFEKRSNPRWRVIFHKELTFRMIWAGALAFTVLAFLAPPFSGLDTLPSLGVVLICLAVILDDVLILLAGYAVGALGVFLVVGLGATIVHFFQQLF